MSSEINQLRKNGESPAEKKGTQQPSTNEVKQIHLSQLHLKSTEYKIIDVWENNLEEEIQKIM